MPVFAADGSGNHDEEALISKIRHIGFRKIWYVDDMNDLDYTNFILTGYDERVGFKFDTEAFIIQTLNVFIMFIIMLQSEIFDSAGYQKFVT